MPVYIVLIEGPPDEEPKVFPSFCLLFDDFRGIYEEGLGQWYENLSNT